MKYFRNQNWKKHKVESISVKELKENQYITHASIKSKLLIFKTHIFSSGTHSPACKNRWVPQDNRFCLF